MSYRINGVKGLDRPGGKHYSIEGREEVLREPYRSSNMRYEEVVIVVVLIIGIIIKSC